MDVQYLIKFGINGGFQDFTGFFRALNVTRIRIVKIFVYIGGFDGFQEFL